MVLANSRQQCRVISFCHVHVRIFPEARPSIVTSIYLFFEQAHLNVELNLYTRSGSRKVLNELPSLMLFCGSSVSLSSGLHIQSDSVHSLTLLNR
jgi:hypothetical protein